MMECPSRGSRTLWPHLGLPRCAPVTLTSLRGQGLSQPLLAAALWLCDSPLAVTRRRARPQGLASGACWIQFESSTTRHDLRLVFEAIPSSRAPDGAASLEVSCVRPSFVTLSCVHSRHAREAVVSALGCQSKRHVSPLRFPTASTTCSAQELGRYCTSVPKGVRCVS